MKERFKDITNINILALSNTLSKYTVGLSIAIESPLWGNDEEKECYRNYHSLREHKKGQTTLLDSLKNSLLQKMDSADNM